MRRDEGLRLRHGWVIAGVGSAIFILLNARVLTAQEEPQPDPPAEAPTEEEGVETPSDESAEVAPEAEAPSSEPTEEPPVEEPAEEAPAEPPTIEEPPATPADKSDESGEVIDDTVEGVEEEPEEPDDSDEEEITVTGTRIGRSNLEHYAPTTVVTSKDIEMSGVTEIDMLLRYIPSVNLSSAKSVTPTGGGHGSAALRGLGSSRTLILLNGARMTVTLSDIPVAMIERVEVLLDGASAIYGTGAIAGVVNIILKKDFEGFDFATNAGISDKGDGPKFGASATMGMTGDKGNVSTNLTFQHRNAIPVQNRSWPHPPCQEVKWAASGEGTQSECGSKITPGGVISRRSSNIRNPIANVLAPDGWTFQGSDASFHPLQKYYEKWQAAKEADPNHHPYDLYNWAQEMVLTSQTTKAQIFSAAHYDFNEYVTAYLTALYSHIRARGRYAGIPLTNANQLTIPFSNPFIPQDFRDDVIDAYDFDYGVPALLMDKRLNDVGARVFNRAANEVNVVAGLKGEIAPGYRWDIFFNAGRTSTFRKTTNLPDYQRYRTSVDPELCYADTQCIMANMFGEGVMQKEAREYIGFDSTATWEWDNLNGNANILMEPFALPGGNFTMVLVGDVRKERAGWYPDSKRVDGLFEKSNITKGTYNAQEASVEMSAPFLAKVPGAHSLTLKLAGRVSHYNYFGNVYTYHAALVYSPIEDILFRGIVSTSYRAPSIFSLYGGTSDGETDVDDPCDGFENPDENVEEENLPSQYTIEQCTAHGLLAKNLGKDFTQATDEVRYVSNPNPDLAPETSQTLTLGTVIKPTFMPKSLPLSATFDVYRIWIYDVLRGVGAQNILRNCYKIDGYNDYCDYVQRDPTTGQLAQIDTSPRNTGEMDTTGFDWTVNLGFPVFQDIRGNFSFMANYLRYVKFNDSDAAKAGEGEGPDDNLTGTIWPMRIGRPKFRFNTGLTFSGTMWAFDNRIRYVHGMKIQEAAKTDPYPDVPAVAYWDMSASLRFDDLTWAVGMDNVLDKIPPYLPGSNYNGNVNMYETIGRYFWTRVQYSFH